MFSNSFSSSKTGSEETFPHSLMEKQTGPNAVICMGCDSIQYKELSWQELNGGAKLGYHFLSHLHTHDPIRHSALQGLWQNKAARVTDAETD